MKKPNINRIEALNIECTSYDGKGKCPSLSTILLIHGFIRVPYPLLLDIMLFNDNGELVRFEVLKLKDGFRYEPFKGEVKCKFV